MTNRDHSTFRLDRRAVSEVVGYTLLIGITTVTVVALLIAATTLQGSLQGSAETETIEQDMQDVDATFGRLAQGDNRSSVRVRTEMSNHLSIVREGEVIVTVNDNCSVQVPMSSIRYEKDGETFANELGGTIRVTDGGQAMVSTPDLNFENGTVDLTITNITGRTTSSMTFVKDVNSSMGVNETDKLLFKGTCDRPEKVTVSITSDFANAWERYAEEEFPTGTVTKSGKTVNITLPMKHLPEAANPAKNTVVNFSNTSHYSIDPAKPSLTIDKPDDNNTYRVRGVEIFQGVQITRITEDKVDTKVVREGIDVVAVLDESGSMDPDKIEDAKEGAKLLVGFLNGSIPDRIALVGYDDTAYRYSVNSQYFSSELGYVNSTIDSNFDHFGWTRINRGLNEMLALYDFKSTDTRPKYAVLLTDGTNECYTDSCEYDGLSQGDLDDLTMARAKEAARNNISIYTIAYGGGADEDLLDDIAQETEGESYIAGTEEELKDVFEEIAKKISTRKKIVYDPSSMSLISGGSVFKPFVPESEYVANYSDYVNINDPSIRAQFSFTFAMDDGEPLNLTAYKYKCDKWEFTGTVDQNKSTGENFYRTRCTDINQSAPKEEIDGSSIVLYTNGDKEQDLKNHLGESEWYQKNLSKVLDPFINDTSGEFNLSKNTAIVAINYSDGQRMVMLLEIGQSAQSQDLSYIVDVKIDNVQVQEKDERNS
jgi:Mg-chelatase subunit ChlD/FlaG/FlaF family flagellin (archaellin)